jgi:hypothetical protein
MTKGATMVMTVESMVRRPTVSMPGCQIRGALLKASAVRTPFPHWLLRDVLPAWLREEVGALPFPPAATGDSLGKRETFNSRRIFVSEENRERFLACDVLADAFQDEATVGLLEDLTGTTLAGGFTRIEYCLDTDGFWLEPHTDIGAKMLTLLIYLSEHPDAENWGTDIMDAAGNVLGRAPGAANRGLVFVPGSDTWHGFTRRPIEGVRRSLIVNYVKPEWRSRHELAFPDQAVVSANTV